MNQTLNIRSLILFNLFIYFIERKKTPRKTINLNSDYKNVYFLVINGFLSIIFVNNFFFMLNLRII